MDLSGKTAIVTGASRGIGKQIAVALGSLGANVVVAARTVDARARVPGTIGETVDAITAAGGNALAVAADMADPDDLERLVAETVEAFGGVDVLVNNAAATASRSWGASLLEMSREEWCKQYDVNLHAPFTLSRAVVPLMAERGGGRIINMTTDHQGHKTPDNDIEGLAPAPLAYPSSKAALDVFCGAVAPQLRAMQVSMVNVHPGFVRTEMVDMMESAGMDASASIPMDIPTRAVVHLVTCDDPMASTGTVIFAEDFVKTI